jgi:hypothetical protein
MIVIFRRLIPHSTPFYTPSVTIVNFSVETIPAIERRYISIMNELTEFSSKFERLRFAICRDCFGAEIVVRYVRRVECSGMSV